MNQNTWVMVHRRSPTDRTWASNFIMLPGKQHSEDVSNYHLATWPISWHHLRIRSTWYWTSRPPLPPVCHLTIHRLFLKGTATPFASSSKLSPRCGSWITCPTQLDLRILESIETQWLPFLQGFSPWFAPLSQQCHGDGAWAPSGGWSSEGCDAGRCWQMVGSVDQKPCGEVGIG